MAACLLASCGAPSGGEEAEALPAGTVKPSSSSPSPVAPKTQLSVPSIYDTSRGWETDRRATEYTFPHSGAVGLVRGGSVTVLDVTNGQTLWEAEVETYGMASALSLTVQGKDYLVVSSSGTKDEDIVSKGKEVTAIDIFTAEAAGDVVKPLHHLELDGDFPVRDGGGGLLVDVGDKVVMTVDVATGETETYKLRELKPPASECKLCFGLTDVVAVTPRGPLLISGEWPSGRYWVPGVWAGSDLSSKDRTKFFMTRVEDSLIASWHPTGADMVTWAVLDPATGKPRATVECEPGQRSVPNDVHGASISAGGRYLVHTYKAFDLEKGTGHCFEETDQDKPVYLNQVTDDGIAFGFGASTDDVVNPRVTVDLTTGQVEAGDYTVAPVSDYSGHGLFWDDSTNTMVVYPHAK